MQTGGRHGGRGYKTGTLPPTLFLKIFRKRINKKVIKHKIRGNTLPIIFIPSTLYFQPMCINVYNSVEIIIIAFVFMT